MINKERFEELIKEGATVWESKYGKVKEFDLSAIGDLLISKEYIHVNFYQPYNFITRTKFSRLFENKEDAEFSKYQNITRTETLSLPTWEEFQKKIYAKSQFIFRDRNGINWFLKDTLKGTTTIILLTNGVAYFKCDYNKKGYLEICEKCKKIFLGGGK